MHIRVPHRAQIPVERVPRLPRMTAQTRLEQARPGGSRGVGVNDAVRADPRHGPAAFERLKGMPCSRHRFACRFVLSLLVSTGLSLAPGLVFADDLQQFELGKTRFDGGEYDKAAERFAAMLDPAQAACTQTPTNATAACRLTDADIIERARAFYAASLVAVDRTEEADLQIAELLRKNVQFSPDPAAFPQKVVDRFTVVRGRLRQELQAEQEKRAQLEREKQLATERAKQAEEKWLASVLRAASEERIVVKNSRFIAALPFGIGQYQNGNSSLGTAFAISEGLLGAVTLVTAQANTYYASVALDPNPELDSTRDTLLTNQLIAIRLNQIAFGAFGVVALTGIIQAQVAFVPETVTVRKRAVPPRPPSMAVQVVPTVDVTKDGFRFGLVGAF